jgi:ribonuclease HII
VRRRLERLVHRLERLRPLFREGEALAAFDRHFRGPGVVLAGVDEVGRGPLAGPLVAAAVVLPEGVILPGLRDSKRLAPAQRRRLAEAITRVAIGWAVSFVAATAIDRDGLTAANDRALLAAVEGLPVAPTLVLVDGPRRPGAGPYLPVVDGDARSQVVAAASVLAKVVRDAFMAKAAESLWPGYGWERNAGYGTREHRQALAALGPSPFHRRSFLSGSAGLAAFVTEDGERAPGAPRR